MKIGERGIRTFSVGQDECDKDLECVKKRLSKTLDALTKADDLAKEQEGKLKTDADIIAKQDLYNAALLDAIHLLVSSVKRDKSFFQKLAQKLEKLLETVTDPKVMTTIATIIIVAKSK